MASNRRKRTATTAAVAERLGVTSRAVVKLINDGAIPAERKGKRWYLNIDEAEQSYESYSSVTDHGGRRDGAGRPKTNGASARRRRQDKAPEREEPTPGQMSRADAQTQVLLRKAKLQDIEIAHKLGRLVDAGEVRKIYTRATTIAARTLNSLSKTCAPRIVAELGVESDQIPVVEKMISEEVARVIAALNAGSFGGPND